MQLLKDMLMESMINTLNGIIWSPALIYLCLAAGLFFSILTRFMQVRHFKEMISLLFARNESPGRHQLISGIGRRTVRPCWYG